MILLVLAILILRLAYIRGVTYGSDESQHLHVAWGWTRGLVQYRDYFDNHTPLFHLMMAPLVRCLGERVDILAWMRLAMFPLWVLALGCIGWLGGRLYSPRAGLWAALLAASSSLLLHTGSEFRADILWMALWFLTLAVGLTGRFTQGRALAFGVLLGVTVATSMKTTLLLVALLMALGIVWTGLTGPQRSQWLERAGAKALAALAGLCLAPLALTVFFARLHAIPALAYCVFQHNTLAAHGGNLGSLAVWTRFFVPLALAFWVGRKFLQHGPDWQQNARRALVFLTPVLFLLCLLCFWPMVTRQDYLPALPLFAIPLAALLDRTKYSTALLFLVALLQIGLAAGFTPPFRNANRDKEALVADILKLTQPEDYVMDAKGENIFRRRPFYFCLENITRGAMQEGKIPDIIAERMVETRTCVTLLRRLTPKSDAWVERHYLPVTDQIWVAGSRLAALDSPSADALQERSFEVGIAADYIILSATGPVQGTMDGAPCQGSVFLNPGPHRFVCNDPRPLDVIWARAVQKGFKPLHLRP